MTLFSPVAPEHCFIPRVAFDTLFTLSALLDERRGECSSYFLGERPPFIGHTREQQEKKIEHSSPPPFPLAPCKKTPLLYLSPPNFRRVLSVSSLATLHGPPSFFTANCVRGKPLSDTRWIGTSAKEEDQTYWCGQRGHPLSSPLLLGNVDVSSRLESTFEASN